MSADDLGESGLAADQLADDGITGAGGQAAMTSVEPLREEIAALEWIFAEVEAGRPLPVVEAEAIVNAMYGEQKWGGRTVFPLVPTTDPTSFLAVHSTNVASLAMALAGSQQFEPAAIRRVGLAALLFDIGMVTIPEIVRRKTGRITSEERAQVMQHPANGARLLLEADSSLDLAATVAYEHHLRMDGSGYPRLIYPRSAHFVSRLVQVCDVFCSLSSHRPYRDAWPLEVIMSFLDERSGFEFHPTIASALTALVRENMTARAAT